MKAESLPSTQLHIRPAFLEDLPLIQSIAYTTWPTTYKQILSNDQLVYMLDMFYGIDSLTNQMHGGHSFFLAVIEDNAVGFASFTHEHDVTYKLQKLYVLPTIQKKGAGIKLLATIEDLVKKMKGEVLLLNVNRLNPAKDFYKKHGFTIIREENIDIGGGYFMNDYVLEKRVTGSCGFK